MCDTPIHMGDKNPNQEEDHCATKQVQTDLETAVGSSGNPQLLMPSIYETSNLSLITYHFSIPDTRQFRDTTTLFGSVRVHQKMRNKKARIDKNRQIFCVLCAKKGTGFRYLISIYAF